MKAPVIQLQNLDASLSLVLPGILLLLVCVSLRRGRVPPNFFVGFRMFKASKENWYRINRYFAEQFMSWCIGMIIIGIAVLFIKRDVPAWSTCCLPMAGLGVAGGKTTGFVRRL